MFSSTGLSQKIENFFSPRFRSNLPPGESLVPKKLESRLKWILKPPAPNLKLKFARNLARFASKRSPPSPRSSSKVAIIQFAKVAQPNAVWQELASMSRGLTSRWLNAPFAGQRKPWPKPKRPRVPASNNLAKKPALQCWGALPTRLPPYSNLMSTSASFPKVITRLECPTSWCRWPRQKREFQKKLPLAQNVVAVAYLKSNKSIALTTGVPVVAPSATFALIARNVNVISNIWTHFKTDMTFPLKSSLLPLIDWTEQPS